MKQWQQARDDAAHFAIVPSLARLATALVQASLTDSPGLRSASRDLRETVAGVVQRYENPQIEALERAVSKSRDATDEALNKPPTSPAS